MESPPTARRPRIAPTSCLASREKRSPRLAERGLSSCGPTEPRADATAEQRVEPHPLLGGYGVQEQLVVPRWVDAELVDDERFLPAGVPGVAVLEREQLGDGGHVDSLRRPSDIASTLPA